MVDDTARAALNALDRFHLPPLARKVLVHLQSARVSPGRDKIGHRMDKGDRTGNEETGLQSLCSRPPAIIGSSSSTPSSPPVPAGEDDVGSHSDPIELSTPCAETTVPATAAAAACGGGVTRCFCCKRKVGLTGFRCRCGELFCGEHRYSDRHVCDFDYKAAARAAIARENPVVRAAKLIRI